MSGVHSKAWLSYCTALYDLFEHGDFFGAWLSYCTACVVILRLYIFFPHHWYGSINLRRLTYFLMVQLFGFISWFYPSSGKGFTVNVDTFVRS